MSEPHPDHDRPEDESSSSPEWRRVRPSGGPTTPAPVEGLDERATAAATEAAGADTASVAAVTAAAAPVTAAATAAAETAAPAAATATAAATAATVATKDTPPSPATPSSSPPEAPSRRRRKPWLIGLIALVAVLVAVLLVVLLNQDKAEPEIPDPVVLDPIPGEIITGPTPTPEIAPVERDKSTAILAAIPDTVLGWAVVSQIPSDLANAQAIAGTAKPPVEAYELSYSNGQEELLLGVTVWRSPEDALQAMAAVQRGGEASEEVDVIVGGQVVGRMLSVEAVDAQDVIWTNGATLFVLRAPAGAGLPFYNAFGL